MDQYSSSKARPVTGDLTKGEWLGTSCPFCGTLYQRAQPHLLRESNQGNGDSCRNCGRYAQVDWGKIVVKRNDDGTFGAFFEPNERKSQDEEITRKVHLSEIEDPEKGNEK